MRTSVILIAIVMLAGCSSSVRTEFATLEDAKQANAFARGWLPPLLPEGATAIVEENNLDHNTGSGTFRFPQEATSQYLQNIGEVYGGLVTKSPFGITVIVTNTTTRWNIKLDPKKGQGSYSVGLTREQPIGIETSLAGRPRGRTLAMHRSQ